jgi:hypothetical protein
LTHLNDLTYLLKCYHFVTIDTMLSIWHTLMTLLTEIWLTVH